MFILFNIACINLFIQKQSFITLSLTSNPNDTHLIAVLNNNFVSHKTENFVSIVRQKIGDFLPPSDEMHNLVP